jgi:hypothetical protein
LAAAQASHSLPLMHLLLNLGEDEMLCQCTQPRFGCYARSSASRSATHANMHVMLA